MKTSMKIGIALLALTAPFAFFVLFQSSMLVFLGRSVANAEDRLFVAILTVLIGGYSSLVAFTFSD